MRTVGELRDRRTSGKTSTDKRSIDEQFDRRFRPFLEGFASRLCSEKEEALDIAQETFLRFWRQLDTLASEIPVEAWLMRVCKNVYVDRCRLRANRPEALYGHMEGDECSLPEFPAPDGDPVSMVSMNLLNSDLWDCIGKLPPEKYATVLLCMGGSRRKAGLILDWKPTTFFNHMKSIDRHLRSCMEARGWSLSGSGR